LRVCNKI